MQVNFNTDLQNTDTKVYKNATQRFIANNQIEVYKIKRYCLVRLQMQRMCNAFNTDQYILFGSI